MSKSKDRRHGSGFSRREFLKLSGVSLAVPLVAGSRVINVAGEAVKISGPSKVPMTFNINEKEYRSNLEPRVTLLDALRQKFDLTGAKNVCDRGTCGACTIIIGDRPAYACSVLAIEAQNEPITTVEGLGNDKGLHPIQQAFIDNDALQCGYCTPGFVVASKAFLDKNPKPTAEEVRIGMGGNLCRCGTYNGVLAAILKTAKG